MWHGLTWCQTWSWWSMGTGRSSYMMYIVCGYGGGAETDGRAEDPFEAGRMRRQCLTCTFFYLCFHARSREELLASPASFQLLSISPQAPWHQLEMVLVVTGRNVDRVKDKRMMKKINEPVNRMWSHSEPWILSSMIIHILSSFQFFFEYTQLKFL